MSERATKNKVWLIEHGDYEQRAVWGVADSLASAVQYVKDQYEMPPYIGTWEEPEQRGDGWRLTGHFEKVLGYSTQHTADFDITPTPVRTQPVPDSGERGR